MICNVTKDFAEHNGTQRTIRIESIKHESLCVVTVALSHPGLNAKRDRNQSHARNGTVLFRESHFLLKRRYLRIQVKSDKVL